MSGPAAPIFRLASLRQSLDYSVNVLGFKIDREAEGPRPCRATAAASSHAGDHPGAWTWIGVPDVGALCEQFRGKGAKIRNPPTNYWWAYEMQVEDLDGNVLRLGSDPLEDQPKGGAFRDMHGNLRATT